MQQNETQLRLTAQRILQTLQQPSTHMYYADESKQQNINSRNETFLQTMDATQLFDIQV